MKKRLLNFSLLIGLVSSSFISAQDCVDNWLSVVDNTIVDVNGNEVKLAGTNWSGFEASISTLEGLYNRDMEAMLLQIKEIGFNHIRVPWHNGIISDDSLIANVNFNGYKSDVDPFNISTPPNDWGPFTNLYFLDFDVVRPLDVLDYMVQWCQDNDMRIVLDNHSREPDGFKEEELWYTDSVPHEQWIADWVFMAERYKDYPAVVAMDLNNEPHGSTDTTLYDSYAAWGSGDIANDWKMAAQECGNAILEVNPNVLIFIEGIEQYFTPEGEETNYWWGGNLQGARDYPVILSDMSKLVYSPHEYGPTVFEQDWFLEPDFPGNMEGIWETQFNFINSTGIDVGGGNITKFPLYIGELGIRDQESVLDVAWYETFTQYIADQNLHWAYWTFNPNSGDTGGILSSDWLTVEEWKTDYLQPILADPIPNCVAATDGTLSNEDFSAEVKGFTVFPNPTTEYIKFSTSTKNLKEVTFYNMIGGEMPVKKEVGVDEGVLKYNLSNFAKGVYLAKVVSEKGIETMVKVVID